MALKAFGGKSIILYDSTTNETVTFQDVVDYVVQLQSENERLNDMKFTKEHCDLYEENEWLKAELSRHIADQEIWVSGYQGTQKENEQLKNEIERLTKLLEERVLCHWYDCEYTRKAVNYTAKEIYNELQGHGTTYVKKWIKKQYDLEV
jgi:hypothetical protein